MTTYQCTKCKATDHDHGPDDKAPKFLNCWKCHAGFGVDPEKMLTSGIGMFPTRQPA